MLEGGGNCLKYLKRGWKSKEERGNKDFKKGGGERQAGSKGGCLKKGGNWSRHAKPVEYTSRRRKQSTDIGRYMFQEASWLVVPFTPMKSTAKTIKRLIRTSVFKIQVTTDFQSSQASLDSSNVHRRKKLKFK